MKSASKNRTALLTIDAIILMLCIFGVYRLTLKAYLPFDVISENSYIVISRIYQEQSHLAAGDTVISIDGHKFSNWEEIELYTDAKNIGNIILPLKLLSFHLWDYYLFSLQYSLRLNRMINRPSSFTGRVLV